MFDSTCPRCGTDAHVRGQATPDGVRLTCAQCGASWLRSERRCLSCGGSDSLTRPQKLVVNPRGNQLATVGLSEVRLCPSCDAPILVDTGPGQWLPDGYVSRFINGTPRTTAPAPRRASAPPQRPARVAPRAQPARSAPISTPTLTNPTVREAMEASLSEVSGLNAGVTTLLAIRLGPFTRLASLGAAIDRERLAAWAKESRLPAAGMETVDALLAHWRTQGWL